LRGTSLSEIEQPMQDSRWTDWQDGSRWRV
jgi:hypothetical protein